MRDFFYFCAAFAPARAAASVKVIERQSHILFMVASLALVALTGTAHAALRSPQVPVAPNALANVFAYLGQRINVVGDQLDLPFMSLDEGTSVKALVPYGTAGGVTFGGYNALRPMPQLYQVLPEFLPMNWFATASFDKAPTRLVVSVFDAAGVSQGTSTYHGVHPTAFGIYARSTYTDVVYSQDARNPGGQPRILAYAATGALAGSIWFACELTRPNGFFGDVLVLATFSKPPLLEQTTPVDLRTLPVGVERTSWGRVKHLFR